MKIFKVILGFLVAIALIGYGVYYFGLKIASDKLIDEVAIQLDGSADMEEIQQVINSDPQLQQFVEEAEDADQSKLAFSTKEEATKVLLQKIGATGLKDIQQQVQDGTASKEEILNEVQSKLTEEELLALKVIVWKELNK